MANRPIPDWKKAAIVGMSAKYGYRSIAKELDINWKTVRKYKQKAEEAGRLEMDGRDLVIKGAS